MLGRAACWSFGALLTLAACSFDGGGVQSDDVDANEIRDRDSDGVLDADDNCPDDANPGQEDEDADAHGNACDNCPSVANDDQANDGETAAGEARDTAGDACDPDPDGPGNDIAYFEGFDTAGSIDDWRVFGGGSWSVSNGTLVQGVTTHAFATLYLGNQQFGGAYVETSFTVDSITAAAPADRSRSFGTLLAFAVGPSLGAGYICHVVADAMMPAANGSLELTTLRGSQAPQIEATADLGDALEIGARYDVSQSMDPSSDAHTCAVESTSLPGRVSLEADDNRYAGGFVALRTDTTAGRFHYVVVYSIP